MELNVSRDCNVVCNIYDLLHKTEAYTAHKNEITIKHMKNAL